jgi:hypothetical protein
MSPLFRKSEEQLAQRAAAEAEIARLQALPVKQLASQLLPLLGPDGIHGGHSSVRSQELCDRLLEDYPGISSMKRLDLLSAVGKGLDALKLAGLVSTRSYQRSPTWSITPLGAGTLEDGTLEQRLGTPG